MRITLAAVLVATAATVTGQQPGADVAPAQRNSSWREITTADFVVTGNASTGELKRTLGELTRFRDSLARLLPGALVRGPVPTYVVVMRDFDDFRRFQPRDASGKLQQNVGGYFSRGADANVIVLPASRGDGSLQTIFHEYTHYFFSRNVRTPVPTWLNEGLADFYSTFRGDYRGKTLIGAAPGSRVAALRSSTFVPLRDIVAPKDLESTWRWERQIGMFYAESWALVHYIMVGRPSQVPNPLSTYLAAFAKSGNHDTAFTAAFGTTVDGMDKELREYVRRLTLPALTADIQVDKQTEEAHSISEADMHALAGRLLLQAGAFDEAERELTPVVKQQPAHAASQIALARLRLTQDRDDEAIAALQQVVAANPKDGAAQYYLGAALERAWRHEESLAAFGKAIDLMPLNPAPWSGLNSAAIGLGRDSQAAAAVQNAMNVEWSPSYYWSQGIEALRLGRADLAAASLSTFLELRGMGEDQSVYPLFVRALAARRAGRPAEADAALMIAEKANPPQEWTRTVLRYLQGRLDDARFLREAGDIGEQTEARTYTGFRLALEGRDDEAVAHFRWVAERGAKTYLEYELARNELNRLKYRNQR